MKITAKIKARQQSRRNAIMDSAFHLFLEQGIHHTSIDDIASGARIAKGTFYLYFKDKFDVRDQLIVRESKRLFDAACAEVIKRPAETFIDDLIRVIDNVINDLVKNRILLEFISKDLSLGVLSAKLTGIVNDDDLDLYRLFLQGIQRDRLQLKNPRISFFMVIELVSSTVFMSITRGLPTSIEAYKPYLYDAIRSILSTSSL